MMCKESDGLTDKPKIVNLKDVNCLASMKV